MNNDYFEIPFWQFYNPDCLGHDIYIEEFGFGICSPGWTFTETRKNYLLQIVFDGIAHVTVGNEPPFSVSKGFAFCLPPNVPHSYTSDNNYPTIKAWISWSGEMSAKITNNFNTTTNPYFLKINKLNNIIDQFRHLFSARTRSMEDVATIYSCFYRIAANCMNPTHPSAISQTKDSLFFNDIVHYVDNNLMNPLTVADIASLFGYDTSTIFRKFKRHTGQSLKDYILHRRIALAMGLICETDLPIDEIAGRCGYNDKASLNMLFLRKKNISLAQYVSEHRS